MDLVSFYKDREIAATLGRYLDAKDVYFRFSKSVEDLSSSECLIPVLGTQGAGKSTFLNAVLFGDIILPVDADETTCIPTVVRYGEKAKPEAFVVMSSGERRTVACSQEGLRDYVHQECNPGNQKGVSHIEIALKHDMLKGGIVFVDLPGVGSITAANQKTTTEYLKKCSSAIFMLRTVPPITQSESVFIQGALPLMGKVFWVQNQWTDESKEEVTEGKEHNYRVLGKIADVLKMPKSAISEPDVVCVYRAFVGQSQGDAQMVEKSGINAFRDKVLVFAKDWRKNVLDGKKAQAIELLTAAVKIAKERSEQLLGDAENERAKIAEEKKKVEEILDANTKVVRGARDYLSGREGDLRNLIATECQKCVENLRNGIRETIDQGVVGGEQLNRAFADHVNRGSQDVFNVIQPAFLDVANELTRMLGNLKDCTSAVSGAIKVGTPKGGFSEKTKVHETYKLFGGIAGGVTGFFAGVKVGAAVGTMIGGPVGTVIGTVAGAVTTMLAGVFGSFCGSQAREIQAENQKNTARNELFTAAAKYADKLKATYNDAYAKFADNLQSMIREWLKDQKDATDDKFRKAVAAIEQPAGEKQKQSKVALKDAEKFEKIANELKGA